MILPINKIKKQGGGKAQGLAFLKKIGINIPETYLVTEFQKEAVKTFISTLPHTEYAVRSSADAEDGAELSFAGQFSSFLNLSGEQEIFEGVENCFKSANSPTVESYVKALGSDENSGMNVLIQKMVHSTISGVLFTADPTENRRDKMVVSVVKGVGEDLMSGREEGETISLLKLRKDEYSSEILTDTAFAELTTQALEIEKLYGKPVDLEWAIDENGTLFWLQLRPITGLSSVHLNELDTTPLYTNPLYTLGNIGEMMPGPVTPLTLSTFVRGIDHGLQVFYHAINALPEISEKNIFIHSFYNRLFFDVNALYTFVPHVLLSKKENIDFSVVGEVVSGATIPKNGGFFRRLLNFRAMLSYLNSAKKAEEKLTTMYEEFRIDSFETAKELYASISEKMPTLLEAWALHYVSSSQSGSYYSALLNIYSRGKIPQREHLEKVARLFTNIPGVESAQPLESIDEIASLLCLAGDVEKLFLELSTVDALHFLQESASAKVVDAWKEFIKRHGHRGVREAEFREKEWALDSLSIVESIKAKVRFFLGFPVKKAVQSSFSMDDVSYDGLNFLQKAFLKNLIPKARKAVAAREKTKALAIGVQYQFKLAYRALAIQLFNEKLLDDEDQIFFLQQSEIGELIALCNRKKWVRIANERRNLYPEMQKTIFPLLSYGTPAPIEIETAEQGELTGIPVSRGIIEGKVRLITTISDASKLQPDEIMVVEYTDIGWTPFYSVAAGLVTEIGSPLSHGAVVAREYGLPTIVSMKGAMKLLKDGQKIRLDATEGRISILL